MRWLILTVICGSVLAQQNQPQPFLAFRQVPSAHSNTQINSPVQVPIWDPNVNFRPSIPQNVQWSNRPQEINKAQQFQDQRSAQLQQSNQQQFLQPQRQQFQPHPFQFQQFQPQQQQFRPQQEQQFHPQQAQPTRNFQQVQKPHVVLGNQQVFTPTETVLRRLPVQQEHVFAPPQGQSQNNFASVEVPVLPEFTTVRHFPTSEIPHSHAFSPVLAFGSSPTTARIPEITTEMEVISVDIETITSTEELEHGPQTEFIEAFSNGEKLRFALQDGAESTTTVEIPFTLKDEEITQVDETLFTNEDTTDVTELQNVIQSIVETTPTTTTTTTEPTTTTTTTTKPTTTTTSTTVPTTTTRRSFSARKSAFKPRTTTERTETSSLAIRTPSSLGGFNRFSSGGYKSNCGCVRILACQRLQISINRCNESEGFMYCCGRKELKEETEAKAEVVPSTTTLPSTSTTETVVNVNELSAEITTSTPEEN